MSRNLACLALLAASIHGTAAHAEDPPVPALSFSGFGTLGVVHSTEHNADFTSTVFKPNGAGFSHSWSSDVDSLIAGQATAYLTPQLSAVVQVIVEQGHDNTYRPYVQWANLKFQVTPDFDIRAGRTTLPTFLVADSRKVGYANPWVRPPVEVYRLVAITGNDGIDAAYRLPIGAATNTFHMTAGQSDSKFANGGTFGGGTAHARQQATFVDTLEQGPATVRMSYGRAKLTIPEFGPLFDAFRRFGAQGVAIADRYAVSDRLATSIGAGASYDPGKWFLMGEWGRINARSILGESTGWYGSGGYRFERFTPYVTYARVEVNSATSDPGLNVSALAPPLAATAAGLNSALNSLLRGKAAQKTLSVGGRLDFMKNVALKLQLDHTKLDPGSPGTLINIHPGFEPGGTLNVISVTMDFVF